MQIHVCNLYLCFSSFYEINLQLEEKKKRAYPERHLLPDPTNQWNVLTWILKIGNGSGKELQMFDQMTLLVALSKDTFI